LRRVAEKERRRLTEAFFVVLHLSSPVHSHFLIPAVHEILWTGHVKKFDMVSTDPHRFPFLLSSLVSASLILISPPSFPDPQSWWAMTFPLGLSTLTSSSLALPPLLPLPLPLLSSLL